MLSVDQRPSVEHSFQKTSFDLVPMSMLLLIRKVRSCTLRSREMGEHRKREEEVRDEETYMFFS